ncbi:MAG: EamA family transporter [Thermoplasmata archaeon]|nr:MAG: EamA family transporter [Thermoplasmata archaeon]
MNTYIVLGLAIIFNAIANILMKIGMLKVYGSENIFHVVSKSVAHPVIPLGIISFILALICYLYVLSKLNLSVAYPMMTSLGFIIVILASWAFLKESITTIQVVGFVFIILGVWMTAN